MGGQTLGHQVHAGLVADLVGGVQGGAGRGDQHPVVLDQLLQHLAGVLLGITVFDRGQVGEGRGALRSQFAQGADALGDVVQRGPDLVVLLLQQLVQAEELRPPDVPVIAVRLLIDGEAVGQDLGQFPRDVSAFLGFQPGVDSGGHGGSCLRVKIQPCS
ncbi:hypothetical protein D3C72_1482280 [compost metagenome]